MALYDYQLASGHSQAGSLQNVEDILPKYNSRQTFYPRGRATFDEGLTRIDAEGLTYETGFQSFTWRLNILTWAQYDYLQDNFTVGGNSRSGKVTVRTRAPGGTYANYNATMILPKMPDSEPVFGGIRDTEIRFIRAVAL